METSAPLINTSSITLCYTPTRASNRSCPKSFKSYTFCGRLAAPDFVMNMYWGQGCSVARSLGSSTGLLHYCTFGLEAANDAQNVRVDDQQNLSKMITWYCSVYNKIAADVWRYNNLVYKPMTNKLQLVLINVLITSLFEHWNFTR